MDTQLAQAFQKVPRKYFVLPEDINRADEDRPLSIKYGQTISQPTTVKQMLEWLNAQPGQRVLDVGSGSGWTSALLDHLIGPDGHVTAVELVPGLVKFGHDNCHNFGCKNVEFHQAGKVYGWPANGPYDRILVSASTNELPIDLINQLIPSGKLVIPIGNTIHEITKRSNGQLNDVPHGGYVFVPLLPGGD